MSKSWVASCVKTAYLGSAQGFDGVLGSLFFPHCGSFRAICYLDERDLSRDVACQGGGSRVCERLDVDRRPNGSLRGGR